ncbi:hypothetical protein [Sphingobacterium spiritivorum]|uniref:hypothetical protein n=1 Tax=Sphingobacterium spiritivorum TaxID=258 RepID=UPI00191824E7|nr:hypothetical protein [Sphingobacterium spiritivorum]QQT27339.1 hypothetical protein I6J02_05655 [Sphingobacterium spiritivorum]
MKKFNISIYVLLITIVTFGLSSCKKDNITLENNLPEIPVTVANQYALFTAPTVSTSLSGGGNVVVELEIPASSGRTIKEITKVAVGTAYSAIQATTGLYRSTPIAGNGTKVTFTTTLAEYATFTKLTLPTAAQAGTTSAVALLARNFYFLITLDNGQTIVPQYVRVYVDK